MRMRIAIAALALAPGLLAGAPATAAEGWAGWSGLEGALEADRPDFTEGTSLIPRGHFQLEGGATVSRVEDVNATTLGEMLIRLGTGERWETRIGVSSYNRINTEDDQITGFDDPYLGIKVRFTDPAGDLPPGRPAVALLLLTSLPVGDKELTQDEWVPTGKLAFSWDLGERFSLGSNLAWSYAVDDGGERFHQAFATLSAGLSWTDRLVSYLEWYGFNKEAPGGPSTHYADAGISFLLNNDLQLDARIGTGLNDADPDWYAGVGATIRW